MSRPALYCGTYGKYNNGSIAGKWLYLEDYEDAEEFFKACAELHKDEHDPEFMFQDFEHFPREMYSECMGSDTINKLIEYAKLTEEQRNLVDAFCGASGYKFGEYSIEQIEDAFVLETEGFKSTEEQVGLHHYENGGIEIPEHLVGYFDFESYGRDLMMDLSEHNGYVFDLGNI